jgi:hypothetical protein
VTAGRAHPRCRGRVDVGDGMTERCILPARHPGSRHYVERPHPVDHVAVEGPWVNDRSTCGICGYVIQVSVTHVWPPTDPSSPAPNVPIEECD